MRQIYLFITLFIGLNSQLLAQQWEWAKKIGTYASMGKAAIKANASGDLFTAANITFQNSHTLLIRTNPSGVITWSTAIDGMNTCLVDVTVDKNDNSYVLGYFAINLIFPDTAISEGNGWQMFIAAYDPMGNRKWVKTFTNPNAGYVTNDENGELIYATFTSSYLWTITKYNQNGTMLWQNSLPSNVSFSCLKVDKHKNIYLTGAFSNSLIINNINYTPISSSTAFQKSFISKFDSSGNVKKVTIIPGGIFSDFGIDSASNYYVAGTYSDSVRIGQTVLSNTCSNAYCYRPFLAKFDTLYNCAWIKESKATLEKIHISDNGSCYVAGSFADTLIIDSIVLYEPTKRVAIYICKINSNGNALWAVKDDGIEGANNNVTCLTGSSNNYIFVGGQFITTSWFGNSTIYGGGYLAHYYEAALNENKLTSLLPNTENNISQKGIFPNPSSGKFSIQRDQLYGKNVSVEILNVLGEKIRFTQSYTNNQIELDLSGNAKGIYFVQLLTENKKTSTKIVLE